MPRGTEGWDVTRGMQRNDCERGARPERNTARKCYYLQIHTTRASGREGHARGVDDDLQRAVRRPAVLERVLDLRLAPIGAREVVLAHRGRGIGEEQGLLVVEADRRLVGVVTNGDVRRYLLRDGDTSLPVSACMNRKFRAVRDRAPRLGPRTHAPSVQRGRHM